MEESKIGMVHLSDYGFDASRNQLFKSALDYASGGWSVLPLHTIEDGKCSCGKPDCKSPGKHPRYDVDLIPDGVKSASKDLDKIHAWWRKWPTANVGIATGLKSGIIVLDVDSKSGGLESYDELVGDDTRSFETVTSLTGGGGMHLFFSPDQSAVGNKVGFMPGLDIRSEGGYVVAPPSIHVSGKQYEWEILKSPSNLSIAPIPHSLAAILANESAGGEDKQVDGTWDFSKVPLGIPEGQRDDTLYRFACSLRGTNALYDMAKLFILQAAHACIPPFPEEEALRKLDQAWNYEPNPTPLTKSVSKKQHVTGNKSPTGYSASELVKMDFPEPVWAVRGIIPEGLTLLCGKPKIGKSWLSLNLALSIAKGEKALGEIDVKQESVLYISLEDTHKRLKYRLKSILRDAEAPDNLYLYTQWPKVGTGGIEKLKEFKSKHPEVTLIIIDTLQKIRESQTNSKLSYANDYNAIEKLKNFADEYGTALLVVHHLRKSGSEDPLDQVSGTTGLTGAADAILILNRGRNQADAVLTITGRDVEENELALSFDKDMTTWTLLGSAQKYTMSKERIEIVEVLEDSGDTLTSKEIADLLGKNENAIRKLLKKLADDGTIIRSERGKYTIKSGNKGNIVPLETMVPTVTTPSSDLTDQDVTDVTGSEYSGNERKALIALPLEDIVTDDTDVTIDLDQIPIIEERVEVLWDYFSQA